MQNPWIQKGGNFPRPSPAVACLTSGLQSNVPPAPQGLCALRVVPCFHQQCILADPATLEHPAILAAPSRLHSLVRARPWAVGDVGLKPLTEEVLKPKCLFPERMSYLKNLQVSASSWGHFETVSPG